MSHDKVIYRKMIFDDHNPVQRVQRVETSMTDTQEIGEYIT